MAELLLKGREIEVSFGLRKVLDISSIELYDGDRIGLVGENGAGKTTLLNVLFGKMKPDAGDIKLFSSVRMIAQTGQTDLEADGFTGSEFSVKEKSDFLSGGECTRRRIAGALSEKDKLALLPIDVEKRVLRGSDCVVIGITTATYDDGAGQVQNLYFAVNISEVIELYAEHKDDARTPLADWKDVNTGSGEINFASSARSFTLQNYAGFSISEVYLYPEGAAGWGKARNTDGWLYKNSSMEIEVTDEEVSLNTDFSLNICFYLNNRPYYTEYTGLTLREIPGRPLTIYLDNGSTIRIEVE